ncbi:MAG: MBL fold metallo-hydrolase [Parashewanella sp.]
MKIVNLIKTTLAFIAISFSVAVNAADKPLKLDVYQADGNSFYVSSVIVTGKTEAALIDAQFTKADAHRVVAKILNSGKKLTTVYVSHGDPDYYFGLQVIKQAFPNVKVYATKETLKHIKATVQKKLDFWGPKLGMNAPAKIVMPELLKGDTLTVDGEKLKVVGLNNHPKRTFVWIPSIKAVVGGVPVYGNVHLWIADAGTKAQRKTWMSILDEITSLKPKVVIPGHATTDTSMNMKSVEFTRNYLKNYEKALAKSDNSKELIDAINKKYPNAVLPIALQIGAKVATGEMKW